MWVSSGEETNRIARFPSEASICQPWSSSKVNLCGRRCPRHRVKTPHRALTRRRNPPPIKKKEKGSETKCPLSSVKHYAIGMSAQLERVKGELHETTSTEDAIPMGRSGAWRFRQSACRTVAMARVPSIAPAGSRPQREGLVAAGILRPQPEVPKRPRGPHGEGARVCPAHNRG